MKTYKNLYDAMLDRDLIENCIDSAAKGKSQKGTIKKVLKKKKDYVEKLLEILEDESYVFKKYETKTINTGTNKKERTVVNPSFYTDQIMHHLIVSQFSPIVMKSLYDHAYGSIPGRGVHSAKKRLERWIKSYEDQDLYVFKCDIKKFYDNIDHVVLKNKLDSKIKDPRFNRLVFDLIDSFEAEPGKGIPKGFATSPWFANFYLTEFDHYLKEQLGIKHYMRYLDDIILLDTDKDRLRENSRKLESFLNDQLKLELKDDYQLYRFVDENDERGRDIDFMGYRFFRNKTTLRKSTLKAIRRKASHLDKKRRENEMGIGQGITAHDARSMLSYLGLTRHADVYNWYQREIKPKVSRRSLRKKVSKKRRQNTDEHNESNGES